MIHVLLVGGLGNQLFGWALGAYLEKRGHEVTLVQVPESRGNKTHGASALDYGAFGFKGPVKILTLWTRIMLLMAKRSRAIQKRISLVNSDNHNGEELIEMMGKARWVIGYHQTLEPSSILSQDQLALGVTFHGGQYVDESGLMNAIFTDLEEQVVMHIRGGDYRNLASSVGLLSLDYYEAALREVKERLETDQIKRVVMLTDDIAYAAPLQVRLARLGYETLLLGPEDLSSRQAFELMACSSMLITSNSTFSFWGGHCGVKKTVAYPRPWNREIGQTLDVKLPKWIPIEAQWQS